MSDHSEHIAKAPGKNRILVIRGGAIGDFILTLPVLAALRQQFPETQLEVIGYPHIVQLAVAGGLAHGVRSIEARPMAGFFARKGTLDQGLQDYFGSFAIIISFLYDPDGIFQENVARCSKAQFIVGPHRPDEAMGVHATEVFLKPLERLAIFGVDPAPRIVLGEQSDSLNQNLQPPPSIDPVGDDVRSLTNSGNKARDSLRRLLPTIALHPGSGGEKKNWPESQWVELLQRLASTTSHTFLLVGGEAEGERLERLAKHLPAERLDLARSLPLVDLARRLAGCAFFIGHDSGITHLAAAVGLPGLALWGETTEAVWRPRSERFQIIRSADGLQGVTVEQIMDELSRRQGNMLARV